jgi:MEKHLA domain
MLLDQVAEQGFTTNYMGMRIGGFGQRFFIEDLAVWQLFDDNGVVQGQGAIIPATREVTSRQAYSP